MVALRGTDKTREQCGARSAKLMAGTIPPKTIGAGRAVARGYRGCGLSNAAIEYPACDHRARKVAEAHKKAARQRLRELAVMMGADAPDVLGDSLLLLIEGIYGSGQQLEDGPAQSAVAAAERLIQGFYLAGQASKGNRTKKELGP